MDNVDVEVVEDPAVALYRLAHIAAAGAVGALYELLESD